MFIDYVKERGILRIQLGKEYNSDEGALQKCETSLTKITIMLKNTARENLEKQKAYNFEEQIETLAEITMVKKIGELERRIGREQ